MVKSLVAAAGAEEGMNGYLYDAPRARSGTGTATRREEMGAETEMHAEPWMPTRGVIGTDRIGAGAETETRNSKDELSARCVDRVLEMRSGK